MAPVQVCACEESRVKVYTHANDYFNRGGKGGTWREMDSSAIPIFHMLKELTSKSWGWGRTPIHVHALENIAGLKGFATRLVIWAKLELALTLRFFCF